MAHDRYEAKRLYVEEGKTVKQICALTGISEKTLYRWCGDEGWEKDRETMQLTPMSAYKSMMLTAVRKLEEMATSGVIDPREADAITKLIKSVRSLAKDIDKRGNILDGFNEFVQFMRSEHPGTIEELLPYVTEFGTWVKRKYP